MMKKQNTTVDMGDVAGGDDIGHEDVEANNDSVSVTFGVEDSIERNEEEMISVNQQRCNNLKENNNAKNNERKRKWEKGDLVLLDFRGAKWNSDQCKYDTSQSEKTMIDEGTIEKWSSGSRITQPYLGYQYEVDDDDQDFKYLDALLEHNEDDENHVPTIPHIFRYFYDHKSNITQNVRGFIRDDDGGVLDRFVEDEVD